MLIIGFFRLLAGAQGFLGFSTLGGRLLRAFDRHHSWCPSPRPRSASVRIATLFAPPSACRAYLLHPLSGRATAAAAAAARPAYGLCRTPTAAVSRHRSCGKLRALIPRRPVLTTTRPARTTPAMRCAIARRPTAPLGLAPPAPEPAHALAAHALAAHALCVLIRAVISPSVPAPIAWSHPVVQAWCGRRWQSSGR